MKQNEQGEIILTQDEARDIRDYIRNSLARAWDRYTDHVICPGVSHEDGMRQMNPEMYDMAEELEKLL